MVDAKDQFNNNVIFSCWGNSVLVQYKNHFVHPRIRCSKSRHQFGAKFSVRRAIGDVAIHFLRKTQECGCLVDVCILLKEFTFANWAKIQALVSMVLTLDKIISLSTDNSNFICWSKSVDILFKFSASHPFYSRTLPERTVEVCLNKSFHGDLTFGFLNGFNQFLSLREIHEKQLLSLKRLRFLLPAVVALHCGYIGQFKWQNETFFVFVNIRHLKWYKIKVTKNITQ